MRKLDSERLKRNEQSLEIVNLNLLSLREHRTGDCFLHTRTYRGSNPAQHQHRAVHIPTGTLNSSH